MSYSTVERYKAAQHWFQLTVEGLLINGKRQRSAETYAREVRNFVKWAPGPVEETTEEDLRQFILYRRNDCQLAGSSMRILYAGVQFFFEHVLQRAWPLLDIMKAVKETPLPEVLSREEVWRVLQAMREPWIRGYYQTLYTCGLRLSEALNLTIHDIDKAHMQLRVRKGKGGKDRRVPLPLPTYQILRRYWVTHQNPLLIFPALGRDLKQGPVARKPMNTSTVQNALQRALKRAGLSRPGVRPHTFRHSYATHLLEAGVHIHAIQRYLGHTRLATTLVYFHLTRVSHTEYQHIIDELMKGA